MSLEQFRDRVQKYRRPTGHTQKALASALNLHPTVLSHKLNGTDGATLTHAEAKQIIRTLAAWEGIRTRAEAHELLALINLKPTIITPDEWATPPLSRLENASSTSSLIPAANVAPAAPPVSSKAAPAVYSPPRSNLPAQPTPLVGREREVATVCDYLRHKEVRLLTLTGPGGIGKTRLGLQASETLRDEFEHGAFFVALAPINDPALVASTIAQALGLKEAAADERAVRQSLRECLQSRQCLLFLDNFEQVCEAAPLVSELLAAAPRLKVLVSSRATLQVYGEHEFSVPALKLPDQTTLAQDGISLQDYEAVQLFIQRARAAQPDFQPSEENLQAVAQICARLDGLPLAIELAAARVKLFSPHQILHNLESTGKLRFLTGGGRNLPARQQTLHNAIEWSYDLLEPVEKTIFTQMAVFVGGGQVAAAEAVIEPAPQASAVNISDGLVALLNQSMLRQTQTAEGPRFAMLETIREFALEQLSRQGATQAEVRTRHQRYYLTLAEEAANNLQGADQSHWLDRLETEHDNLRAALDWALLSPDHLEPGLRLANALATFWEMRGHVSEGRERLARLLAATPAGPERQSLTYARALHKTGLLARLQGDHATAQTLLLESLEIRRQLGDKQEIAAALNGLGNIALLQDDYKTGREYYEQSLALNQALNDQRGISLALNNLGNIALHQSGDYRAAKDFFEQCLQLARQTDDKRGIAISLHNLAATYECFLDFEQAHRLYEQSLVLRKELGDKRGIALGLNALGGALLRQGQYAPATACIHEALQLRRSVGDKVGQTYSFYNLGLLAFQQEDYVTACQYYWESLLIARQLEAKLTIAMDLEGLAAARVRQGQAETALHLLAAAAHLRQLSNTPRKPYEQTGFEESLAAARSAVSVPEYERLWQEGEAYELERAIAVALEVEPAA